jgi:hypothetical protein
VLFPPELAPRLYETLVIALALSEPRELLETNVVWRTDDFSPTLAAFLEIAGSSTGLRRGAPRASPTYSAVHAGGKCSRIQPSTYALTAASRRTGAPWRVPGKTQMRLSPGGVAS